MGKAFGQRMSAIASSFAGSRTTTAAMAQCGVAGHVAASGQRRRRDGRGRSGRKGKDWITIQTGDGEKNRYVPQPVSAPTPNWTRWFKGPSRRPRSAAGSKAAWFDDGERRLYTLKVLPAAKAAPVSRVPLGKKSSRLVGRGHFTRGHPGDAQGKVGPAGRRVIVRGAAAVCGDRLVDSGRVRIAQSSVMNSKDPTKATCPADWLLRTCSRSSGCVCRVVFRLPAMFRYKTYCAGEITSLSGPSRARSRRGRRPDFAAGCL